MDKSKEIPVFQNVMTEQNQGHETRIKLFVELEKLLNLPVVSFFTSFIYPVMIEDTDADMIEALLQKMDLSNGLALIINSPGGIGIAAERIINVCKSYSGTGEFITLVPGKAKSAATMVCLGSSKIYMSPTSELGPIDPQISIQKDGKNMRLAICNIVESYKELFDNAVNTTGHLEPFLQQLSNYDAREIKEFNAAIELAKDVAIRALKKGMMNTLDVANIVKNIEIFLTPETTKTHGRAIFHEEAKASKLIVELMSLDSNLWKLLYELYIRTNNLTNTRVYKCIETKDHSLISTINVG